MEQQYEPNEMNMAPVEQHTEECCETCLVRLQRIEGMLAPISTFFEQMAPMMERMSGAGNGLSVPPMGLLGLLSGRGN